MNTPTNPQPLLSVTHLSVDFRLENGKSLRALERLNLSVNDGEVVALVGESGSGKSVCSLAIMGLLQQAHIAEGEIFFRGQNLLTMSENKRRAIRGRDITMVFQDPMTSLNPVHRVGNQIAESLALHRQLFGSAAQKEVISLLTEVGMTDPLRIAQAYPHQISGGQQQRVMLALSLACQPKILIADEPTTALDVTIQKQVLELIVQLQKKHHMAVLFITHDLALVRQIAHRVVVLRQGKLREEGSVQAIFNHPQDAYTQALLACRPPKETRPYRLPTINDFMKNDEGIIVPTATSNLVEVSPLHASPSPAKNASVLLEGRNINTWLGRDSWLSGQRRSHIVHDVSFSLKEGETLGIVGESGSGKTTLGMTIMRLIPDSNISGSLFFNGVDLLALSESAFLPYRRQIQIIFQNPLATLNPRMTVGSILTEPLSLHRKDLSSADRESLARDLLNQVGLSANAWNRYPHEFSGGQCQRIAIARCLTLNPKILICDESVSALDVSIQAQTLNLLRDLQEQYALSYLFISHDLSVVRYLSNQVMVMYRGSVVEHNAADLLFTAPQHDYTKNLISAIP